MSSVEELGERRTIEVILKHLELPPSMPIPFGDDVSATDLGHGRLAIIKTDMLVGRTDVPHGMSLWQAARKAVVMNVSDLAAKGVQPLAVLASLGLPTSLTKKDIKEISKGLNAGAREYKTHVIGGDTNEASDLIISCMAFGICKKSLLMKRTGARPGDFLAVTGFFGMPPVGLKILVEESPVSRRLRKGLVESVLMPQARLEEGLTLSRTKSVTSSIDSSDGLALSLHEISKASGIGFSVDNLPIAKEAMKFSETNSLDSTEFCLYGGEEYELVVTIRPRLWEKAKNAVRRVGGILIEIGTVTRNKAIVLEEDGETTPIEAKGWEHFKHST